MAGNIRASYPSVPGAFRRMPTTLNSYQSGGRPQHPLEQRMGLNPGSTNPADWGAQRAGASPVSEQMSIGGAVGRLLGGQATFGQQPSANRLMDFGSGSQVAPGQSYQTGRVNGFGSGIPQREAPPVIDGPNGQAGWGSGNAPTTMAQSQALQGQQMQSSGGGWTSSNAQTAVPVQPGGTPFFTLNTQPSPQAQPGFVTGASQRAANAIGSTPSLPSGAPQQGLSRRAAPSVLANTQPVQGLGQGATQRAAQAIGERQSLPGGAQGQWGQVVPNQPQGGPVGPATSQRSIWDDASQFASGAAAGAVTGNPLVALGAGIVNAASTENPNSDEYRAKQNGGLKGDKLKDPTVIAAATGLPVEDVMAYLQEGYQFGSNNGKTFMVGPDGVPTNVAPHAGTRRAREMAADEARFQGALGNIPQINAQDQVDAINAQAEMGRSRSIRSAMNAGARSGMSSEAMIGQTADIQNQTQATQVVAASAARAQAAVQNANIKMQAVQAELQHIENRIRETNDQAVRDKLFQQQQWLLAKQQEFQAKQISDQREYDTWTSLLNTGLGGGLQVAGMAAGGAFGGGGASGSAAG